MRTSSSSFHRRSHKQKRPPSLAPACSPHLDNEDDWGGGGKGIRTPDLLIANETLYQLSYTPHDQGPIISTGRPAEQAVFALRVVPLTAPRITIFAPYRASPSQSIVSAVQALDLPPSQAANHEGSKGRARVVNTDRGY